MKLTTIILLAAFLQVSAATFAQKVTLNQKKAALAEIFTAIHEQTGYNVLWSGSALKGLNTQDVNFKDAPFREVLDEVLKSQPLTYEVQDKTVLIKKKQNSVPNETSTSPANAPPVTVSGTVTDETGQPLSGVTVKIKGTITATATDGKGVFSLTVPDVKTIISFSFIGYETQEFVAKDIPAGSIIVLKASQTNLKEVVVSKGYYNITQELNTGNVFKVESKDIDQQPVADPIMALVGRVPGLNIQQTSGLPGSNSTIRLRGVNSIANGNSPLFIVDGVPYNSSSLSSPNFPTGALGYPLPNNQLAFGGFSQPPGGFNPFDVLNPSDIESVEVLKDADATAIYGSRGANGVILITTKKGKASKTELNVNSSQGWGTVAHNIDMLNSQQYIAMRLQAKKNDNVPISASDYDINGTWDKNSNTDWQKYILGGTAEFTNLQASLSGGNSETQFLVSGDYMRQTTVFPIDNADRKGGLHFSINHISQDQKLQLTFNGGYNTEYNNLPQLDPASFITLAPDAPSLLNPDGTMNLGYYNGQATFEANPIAGLINNSVTNTSNLIANLNLSYKLLPDLYFRSNFGFNEQRLDQKLFTYGSSAPSFEINDPYWRSVSFANNDLKTWIIEPQFTYSKSLSKGKLDVLVGSTFQQNEQQSSSFSSYGYNSDQAMQNPLNASSLQMTGNNNTLYRYNAIFGRIGYNWEEKYLLNLTGRRDGSSRFGPGKQFGTFGAVGAGWIFSKEKWFNENNFLSFGKLRASYGVTGNDQTNDYQFLSTYSSQSSTYQGITGLKPTLISNPNFGWEQVRKLEGGLELGLLKDRIFITTSYYRDRTTNQLVGYKVPYITGFSTVPGYNLPAVIQNNGWEFTLNTTNIAGHQFKWTTALNFTIPHNKLLSYPELSTSSYKNTYTIGQSLFATKQYKYTGVDPKTGLYTFLDANNDGSLSNADWVTGPAITQKFYGGIQNSFVYNNISLDIFIQYVNQTGLDYRSAFNGYAGQYNFNEPTAVLNAWNTPGQQTTTQRYGFSNNAANDFNNFLSSNAVVTGASFLRVKTVALSYNFPITWQKSIHAQKARIYLEAENLFTVTKYVGLDPETGVLTMPPLRMISAGFQLTF